MQTPKKIAYVVTTFVTGGLERSLLDLLDVIDRERYDITVFLPDEIGEWTPFLKEKCRVRILDTPPIKELVLQEIRNRQFFQIFRTLYFRTLARILFKTNYHKSHEYLVRSYPGEKEEFDWAGAYQIVNDDCVLSCLFRLKANRKAVWNHLNMNQTDAIHGKWYNLFDTVFCVSEYSKRAILEKYPHLESKTSVLYNVINPKRIRSLAQEQINFPAETGVCVLVTVARLSEVKGQIIIPTAARILKEHGAAFRWYLIGEGESRSAIEDKIREENVEDVVFLLGNQNNPYPYIKACDIYVQTSFVEGWGLTVSEAKILGKPIVTTDAGVMSEQIQSGHNGVIVSAPASEAIAEEILYLLKHPEKRERFKEALANEDVGNKHELDKLYQMIEREPGK